ncbi:MAG: hypothetical protein WC044_12475 [Crocinitomicaceae bacterium]
MVKRTYLHIAYIRLSRVLSLLITVTFLNSFQAQVGVGTSTPDASAMLEVTSNSKGFLLPRMSSAQRIAIASPLAGLQVYDNQTNSIWYFNGTYWVDTQAMASVGDVKSGIQTADHNGWIKLDGRLLSALTAEQQTKASSLGLSTNLPNAADAYLVQNGSGMGAVSGSNTTTINQTNLPNVNFTGTAASAGNHSHVTNPAVVTSSSDGNHAHTTDPAAVNSGAGGDHNHQIGRRLNEDNGAYDPGNGHAWENSAATTDRTYVGSFSTSTNGNHTHVVDVPSTTSSTNGNHAHTVDVPATTSTTDGAHVHTVSVSSGGSGTPINVAPKSMSVNMFIYLGL